MVKFRIRQRQCRFFVYVLVAGGFALTMQYLWKEYVTTQTLRRKVKNETFTQTTNNTIKNTTMQTADNTIKGTVIKRGTEFDLQKCIPDLDTIKHKDRTDSIHGRKTPFRIFVYDLPPQFNRDILKCLKPQRCFQLDYCGMGPELYEESLLSVRDTHQFSLEVIIHHQMLFSPYRTLDPESADIFYIPAYLGLACFCHSHSDSHRLHNLTNDLFNYLKSQKFYPIGNNSGKIHVSSLAKIEREQASARHCSLLQNSESKKILFLGIEKEGRVNTRRALKITNQRLIVVPYPSYGHIINNGQQVPNDRQILSSNTIDSPPLNQRHIFLFLAAGYRRSNKFRARLMDQFVIKTNSMYAQFFSRTYNSHGYKTSQSGYNSSGVDQIMLYTRECEGDHKYSTITWMRHSIFCLQPPGDSPTRKSFYDSIVSGCIPVIFDNDDPVTYPFDNLLQYSEFTVKLQRDSSLNLYDSLKEIKPGKITELLLGVQKVAPLLQYNVPNGKIQQHTDAMTLIMAQLERYFIQKME